MNEFYLSELIEQKKYVEYDLKYIDDLIEFGKYKENEDKKYLDKATQLHLMNNDINITDISKEKLANLLSEKQYIIDLYIKRSNELKKNINEYKKFMEYKNNLLNKEFETINKK